MKVRTAFTFTEEDARRIRAAIGRSGKATRKESLVFIDRAVRDALAHAPKPKPARRKVEKVARAPRPETDPIEQRERIKSLYRTSVEGRA